ncbi:S9 family peptidase [Hyalangium versicolor]|uniref:S9 family peptidase n=1 Tax=Hyalangium versicolor TaxID=2861190 RepID=UPI001CCD038F|nr:S9 family peptidase [Hyalangium versicolor]
MRWTPWAAGLVLMLGTVPAAGQPKAAEPRRSEATVVARAQVPARPAVADVVDALARVVRFKEVEISPDGARVAWIETVPSEDESRPTRHRIQVVELAHPEAPPVRIAAASEAGFHEEEGLAWSPDGRQLAFLSDAEKEDQPQLYVADVVGGNVRKLTSLTGQVSNPRWSPDGRAIALLVIEGAEDIKGPMGPAARETGVVEEEPAVRRIAVVGVADGRYRVVSPAGLFVHEYAWSPDGQRFAVTAAPPPGDANWWVAQLSTVSVATGATQVLYKPTLQITEPTWSPDGRSVAFIQGLMSDEGVNGGDVFIVPAKGGKARNVTPGLKASPTHLFWLAPGRLLFAATAGSDSAVAEVEPERGTISVLWRGPERIAASSYNVNLSLARDGVKSALVRETFTQPPEIYAGPLGKWTALTRRNEGVKSPAGPARSLTWKSDGWEVQGWLVAPPSVPAGTRAPMITVVHGGPAGVITQGFHAQTLVLASQGYYVFLPNARGSFGQGEAFVEANRRDFGYGDLRDVLAGVDAVLASEPVDGNRLGITGWSYGGFMTMWAVTQTQRFRAAVAGAGIANWQSYYGTNQIDTWMLPYFGASVYDEPEVYARSSPMNFVKQVRTPTLVLHGERDAEVPVSQGREFYKALKTLGVKTQLVVYPDEGHSFRKPAHSRDRYARIVGWFDTYLAPTPAKVDAAKR